jgi:hypothetical protein
MAPTIDLGETPNNLDGNALAVTQPLIEIFLAAAGIPVAFSSPV